MRPALAVAAAVLLAALPPAAAREKPTYVDVREPAAQPVGLKDPLEEMQEIIRKVERGELPKVQFDFDSDKILLKSRPTLDAVADLLLRNPRLKMMVIAHTCTIGTGSYNLTLSRKRARSVREYLVKKGIPPPSIRYRGMGYSQPIADNSTEEGRERNRRVEFRVTFREWNSVY